MTELTEQQFREAVYDELRSRCEHAVVRMAEDYATDMASMGPCDVADHEGMELTEANAERVAVIDMNYFYDLPEEQQQHWIESDD